MSGTNINWIDVSIAGLGARPERETLGVVTLFEVMKQQRGPSAVDMVRTDFLSDYVEQAVKA
ncbi:MAG: hypothetical protein ACR2KT_01650 [Methylocella sp.]|nr:MAG: hypothetical protein DLM68_10180 [Hyphomicrobiales bacterium]